MTRTLVIFAKSPELGRVKTRLQPHVSAAAALELHRAFVHDTVRLALHASVERRVVAFSGEPAGELVPEDLELTRQHGADLGERLTHAARDAFARGATRVVFVGTDSPDLPAERLDEAFRALERAPLVLGPAADGGYYLIGLAGPHTGVFERIDWGSDRVAEQTRTRAAALGLTLAELEPWFDVDRAEDLDRLAAELRGRSRQQPDFPHATARELGRLGWHTGSNPSGALAVQ